MKITKLTSEQEARLSDYREKWLGIGLSTGNTDYEASKTAVCDAYKIAGLEPPKIFVRLEGPFKGIIGAHFLRKMAQVGAQVWAQVWDQVRAQVRDQVWAQVGDQVGDQVWAQVWDQVRDQVGDQVWAQVGDQVGAQVRAQVRDQVGAQVGAQVWDQVWDQVRDQVGDQVWAQVSCAGYGLHDASWLGFYEFFGRECGLEICNRLEPLARLAQHCGWWWPFEGAVIITDKPIALYRDDRHRLHAEGKKAIEYSDGFGIYAFHGVRLPDKYGELHSSKWQSSWILKENNAEIRRALIQGVGYERLCRELHAKEINSWREYSLLRIKDNIDIEPINLIKMTCPSTGHIHIHRVPPDIKKAREAITWVNHGIDPEEFLFET